MTEYKSLKPQEKSAASDFNVIIADTRWETFEHIPDPGEGINLLNLSSSFAVNFIIDYERIDVVIMSRRISGLDAIIRKAQKKKASVFIMGEDINYPLEAEQVIRLLENEKISRAEILKSKRKAHPGIYIKKLFGIDSEKRLLKHARKSIKEPGKAGVQNNKSNLSGQEENYEEIFWGEKKPGKHDRIPYSSGSYTGNPEQTGNDHIEPAKRRNSHLNEFVAIKQKIIVFLKAKGGVGSTLLSLFIAYHFRKLKTLLVDLNFCEGGSDIGYYLNIPKSPNMIVFIEGYNRNAMENSVVKIKDNLDVLACSIDPKRRRKDLDKTPSVSCVLPDHILIFFFHFSPYPKPTFA